MTLDRDSIIRASEIGQYLYCARAWYLGRVLGYRSSNVSALRQGVRGHRAHGRSVRVVHRLRLLGAALVLVAALVLLAWLLTGKGPG